MLLHIYHLLMCRSTRWYRNQLRKRERRFLQPAVKPNCNSDHSPSPHFPTVYLPIIISRPLPSYPTPERKVLACRLSIGVTPNPCAPLPVSEAATLRRLLGNAIGYVKVVDCSALPIDVCPHCLPSDYQNQKLWGSRCSL